ncbi:MAG: phosphatidylglycerol lysyltransferase domain-containing protein, partial [Nocardioidaceae bacterium]
LGSRKHFTAKPDPRSLSRLVAVLVLGPVVATVLGWMWLAIDADGQAPGTTFLDRVAQAFLGLVGISGPVTYVNQTDADRAAVALVVLGASVVLLAVLVALQPATGPHPLTDDERGRLGGILQRWGGIDSLSYFALRDDRSVVFSPSGKSAVTYRVVGTVSLAAGDPLGDPEAWPGAISAWLDEARSYGWVPAVLAASERGAEAFHRFGLDALELGDEAILHLADFSLDGRSMRGVRQAVSRCNRAGLTVSCHRVADLSEERRELVLRKAEEWRDGAVERGFSMALGRFGSREDGRSVVVLSTDADGELRGLLHFVPWGEEGLSLDLMRRDRDSENGIVEQMVAGVMADAAALGVKRVSLNFAVFRSVFARGERLGAGPVLRVWRSLLLGLSRFWQIESLYRANAKYQPEWVPRFVCFRSSADLPRVGIAALRAEAFLVAPRWVQRFVRA